MSNYRINLEIVSAEGKKFLGICGSQGIESHKIESQCTNISATFSYNGNAQITTIGITNLFWSYYISTILGHIVIWSNGGDKNTTKSKPIGATSSFDSTSILTILFRVTSSNSTSLQPCKLNNIVDFVSHGLLTPLIVVCM